MPARVFDLLIGNENSFDDDYDYNVVALYGISKLLKWRFQGKEVK